MDSGAVVQAGENKQNKMKLAREIEIMDLALYIRKHKALVISDVHIGYEEALNKQGILVPRFQLQEIVKRFEAIAKKLEDEKKKIRTIIINGDIKHEFGRISDQEWRDTLKFLDLLSKHCEEIILVKGNHDTILGPIAGKRNVQVENYVVLGDILVAHGDKIVKIKDKIRTIKTIIIGHEHPAISFKGRALDKFKCFLKGKWQKKELIVMPSFFLVTEGTDVLREKLLSPYLREVNLGNFDAFVVGDKAYNFGKLKNIYKKIT